MPKLLQLDTFNADSGNLTVFEKIIPGTIKRVFYIYGATELSRGGHRHHSSWNALICLNGSCHIYSCDGKSEEDFILDNPASCLVLEPKDWHIMDSFSKDSILLVLSNEYYDRADYIDEPYLLRSQEFSL
ncbi:sugar 3,4-ketoisomerase [Dyadobacter subterraneus]|uniref:FdtA/QdtA family cupin domain-containing protein n=1 Tax=Dyadobacter subterraneus TaxID=2773304 RepID=A0ABR9WLQ2_9BACT|nr:FdtA/QdtA family cupin domain-containing protein [Dyadobacter subterraneus]MBE9466330.1 FdtA/QdtA family cupin domain-containing protein [Dyadobacter subterraneus]